MAKTASNTIKFEFSLKNYPLEAIYGTAYSFIDRAFLFLDSPAKDIIEVNLTGKKKLSKKQLDSLKGEFLNELLNYTIRAKLLKSSKKIRELIISQALVSAIGINETCEPEKEEVKFEEDPLGIAIPWEDKYGKTGEKK